MHEIGFLPIGNKYTKQSYMVIFLLKRMKWSTAVVD